MWIAKGLRVGVLACWMLSGDQVRADAVGRLAGEPSVSIAGASQYTLPLPLPAGILGIEPSLALVYDSRAGNGLLGVGFRLSGLSSIHRCGRTHAQDGAIAPVRLDASDRFCLDGARLRLTSGSYGAAGSQYQTEVEQFVRVTAYGVAGAGPASFTVEAPDGLRYDYGATEDSRIESQGSATARTWALNRIRDRSGNRLDVTYSEDAQNGVYRPARIDYTTPATGGSPAHSVRFVYEPRPDVTSAYLAGGAIRENRRLDRIDVTDAAGTVLRQFELGHAVSAASSRSRLVSVRACASSNCLPATYFAWLSGTPGWGAEQATPITPSQAANAIPGDVDGDGREDLLYFDGGFGRWAMLPGTTAGYSSVRINTGFGKSSFQARALAIDIDADGRRDLLVPHDAGAWYSLRMTSGGGFAFTSTGVADDAGAGNTTIADIDGDGREDLVIARAAGTAIHWRRNLTTAGTAAFAAEALLWSAPSGMQLGAEPFGTLSRRFSSVTRAPDFNGDGATDLLVAVNENPCAGQSGCTSPAIARWRVLASTGAALVTSSAIDAGSEPLLADLNSDAMTDLLYASGAHPNWQITLAAGARGGSQVQMTAAIATPIPVAATALTAAVADWDGDGRGDLLVNGGGAGWLYCASTGESLQPCLATGLSAGTSSVRAKLADVNGDGLGDFSYPRNGWNLRLHQPGRADRLDRITDGLGHWASFDYRETSDPLVHTPRTGAAYPVCELRKPIEVVGSLRRSDGIGGTAEFKYTYEGARVDLRGRGFLGFARRTVTDTRDALATLEDYAQDPSLYEQLGRVVARTTRVSTLVLDRTTVTWDRMVLGTTAEPRSFAYPRVQLDERYVLAGPHAGLREATAQTQLAVDAFGTPVETTRTVTEFVSGTATNATHVQRRTLNGIVNDTANWCLGRPATVQTVSSHSLPGGGAITRTIANSWDSTNCRLNQQVAEPSSTKYRVARDYTYDLFGHRAQVTVTPVGGTARTTSIAWGTDGRFVSAVTNAEGERTAYTFDAATGTLQRIEDAIGLSTLFSYDEFGRRTSEQGPDGTSTETQWSNCAADCPVPTARIVLTTIHRSPAGAALATEFTGYDELGRTVFRKHERPGGAYDLTINRYDRLGRLQERSLPAWCCGGPTYWARYAYDVDGRPLSVMLPPTAASPIVRTWNWRWEGLTSSMTDPAGRTTTTRVDPFGRTVQVLDANGAEVRFGFDAVGNLLTVLDAGGATTTNTYDEGLYPARTVDANTATRSYEFSALGEPTRITDARGKVTNFTYDKLSRRLTRNNSDGLVTWTWGRSVAERNVGRLVSVASSGYSEGHAYDALGRLAATTTSADGALFTTRFGYDGATGRPGRMTFPASTGSTPLTLEYLYDRGRVTAVRNADEPSTTFWQARAFDAAGLAIDEALGNGVAIFSEHDPVTGALLTRTAGRNGGSELQDLSLLWDGAGNVLERRDQNAGYVEQFEYDSLERLQRVSLNGAETLRLSYETDGNIASKSDVGAYDYDDVRLHAVVSAGANDYSYDENGSLRRANGATLSWTAGGQLRYVVHPNGNQSVFSYDPDGSRYRQVARNGATNIDTIYGADGLFEKVTRDGSIEYRHYVVADGRRVAVHIRKASGAASTSYFLQDHLGSTDAIASDSGALLARFSYGAFGERRASNGQPGSMSAAEWQVVQGTTSRGFTGHEHLDNIGVIHMDGRVYDPVLGRFMSPDPLVSDVHDPQTFNRYSYVRNNPLTYVDPAGFAGTRSTGYCVLTCREFGTHLPWGLQQVYAGMLRVFEQPRPHVRENNCPGPGGCRTSGTKSDRPPGASDTPPETAPTSPESPANVDAAIAATVVAIPAGATISDLLIGAASGLATAAGPAIGVVAGVLVPSTTAEDSDLLDDEGRPRDVYHFTDEIGRGRILESGVVRPGASSGIAYVSPNPYPTIEDASQFLALPRPPSGYFRIPAQNLPESVEWGPVPPSATQPGGGIEGRVRRPISVRGATWVELPKDQ